MIHQLTNRFHYLPYTIGCRAPISPGSIVPVIAINGYASTSSYNGQTEQLANTYEFGGDLTKVLNRHTVKAAYSYSIENFVVRSTLLGKASAHFRPRTLRILGGRAEQEPAMHSLPFSSAFRPVLSGEMPW
jgi:hypothetical protein